MTARCVRVRRAWSHTLLPTRSHLPPRPALLLIDLGMLAGLQVPEVAFLCIVDALMVGSGYAGFVAGPDKSWIPLFLFGCASEGAMGSSRAAARRSVRGLTLARTTRDASPPPAQCSSSSSTSSRRTCGSS